MRAKRENVAFRAALGLLLALQVPTSSVKTCRRCTHQSFRYTFAKHYRKLLRKFFLCCFLQRAARCPANADNARVMRSRSRALCRPLRRWRQYCYSTTRDTSVLCRYNAKSIKATVTSIPAHHHHAHHATNCRRRACFCGLQWQIEANRTPQSINQRRWYQRRTNRRR